MVTAPQIQMVDLVPQIRTVEKVVEVAQLPQVTQPQVPILPRLQKLVPLRELLGSMGVQSTNLDDTSSAAPQEVSIVAETFAVVCMMRNSLLLKSQLLAILFLVECRLTRILLQRSLPVGSSPLLSETIFLLKTFCPRVSAAAASSADTLAGSVHDNTNLAAEEESIGTGTLSGDVHDEMHFVAEEKSVADTFPGCVQDEQNAPAKMESIGAATLTRFLQDDTDFVVKDFSGAVHDVSYLAAEDESSGADTLFGSVKDDRNSVAEEEFVGAYIHLLQRKSCKEESGAALYLAVRRVIRI